MVIIPGDSIGNVKIGMSIDEVVGSMNETPLDFSTNNQKIHGFKDGRIQVHYDSSGFCIFIEVSRDLLEDEPVTLDDFSIFSFPVEKTVVTVAEKFSIEPIEIEEGTTYIYNPIGISLWRSSIFDQSILNQTWFKELDEDCKREETRTMYFETISIWKTGYYDQILSELKLL